MTTEPGEPQEAPPTEVESFPEAAAHSTPKQGGPSQSQPQSSLAEDTASHLSSTNRIARSPARNPLSFRTMQCKVTLLDGSLYTCTIEKRARGLQLFENVCDHINLLERDYFALSFRDSDNQKNWLDPSKDMKKQVRGVPWDFSFSVKFYPPDPAQLSEDITRYFLCLQLRQDVVSGRLPCSFATHTVLGSYTVQSELGDYDPDESGSDYVSELHFAPNQTKEMEEKIMELHRNYRGMTPAEAELHFLENVKKLSMYGVDLHHAKLVGSRFDCLSSAKTEDSEGVSIMLGVCSSGLLVYRDRLRINRFSWPKILKISYKRNNFYIKIRPGEFDQFESTIGFKLQNHRAAKRLWKVCVEHHSFFRLLSPEEPPKKFLSLGSKFRYSGRTQVQTRRASAQIARPAPHFPRCTSKRYTLSRSLDGAPRATPTHSLFGSPAITAAPPRANGSTHTDMGTGLYAASKAIAVSDLITTVTPEKRTEEKRAEPAEEEVLVVEETELTDTAMDDLTATESDQDEESELKTQEMFGSPEELLKHQLTISALRRSFLEGEAGGRGGGEGGEGMTEWEKRLASSPLRRIDDAPMIEPLELEEPKPTLDEMSPELTALLKSARDQTTFKQHNLLKTSEKVETVFLTTESHDQSQPMANQTQVVTGSPLGPLPSNPTSPPPGACRVHTDDVTEEWDSGSQSSNNANTVANDEASDDYVSDDEAGSQTNDEDAISQASQVSEDAISVLAQATAEEAVEAAVRLSLEANNANGANQDNTNSKSKQLAGSSPSTRPCSVLGSRPTVTSRNIMGLNPGQSYHSGDDSEDSEEDDGGWRFRDNSPPPSSSHVASRLPPHLANQTQPADRADDAEDDEEVPVVMKTLTYEVPGSCVDPDPPLGVVMSSQTFTAETSNTTTTTHITKTVKGGISETRIEKRIVISGDTEIDHDEALAAAISEARRQHPELSVTRVVVHKETEVSPDHMID
ncbi:band 4.1-like protein 3a [Diretmus argenteus]